MYIFIALILFFSTTSSYAWTCGQRCPSGGWDGGLSSGRLECEANNRVCGMRNPPVPTGISPEEQERRRQEQIWKESEIRHQQREREWRERERQRQISEEYIRNADQKRQIYEQNLKRQQVSSVCATNAGRCLLNGYYQIGISCGCNTPYGQAPGQIVPQ